MGPDSFVRFLGVDWSGAVRVSSQHIYVAEVTIHSGRLRLGALARAANREAVEAWLLGEQLASPPSWNSWLTPPPPRPDERVLVGLDFAFGFPATFRIGGATGWSWDQLAEWADKRAQEPNLIDAIAADESDRAQFRIGAGGPADLPLRRTEEAARDQGFRPTSVCNLVGASQVGAGSIRGIPILRRLREQDGIAVWPLDDPDQTAVVIVEVFPRMWLDANPRKEHLPERVRQLQSWENDDIAMDDRARLTAASSADVLDAAAAAIGLARGPHVPLGVPAEAEREGWIMGISPSSTSPGG